MTALGMDVGQTCQFNLINTQQSCTEKSCMSILPQKHESCLAELRIPG